MKTNLRHFARLSIVATLGVLAFSTASANLIKNGSFEATSITNGSWAIFQSLPSWTASGLGVELRNAVAGNAYAGRNYVELDTTGNSWISQAVATTVGEHYSLSFYYAPRQGVSSASNPLNVLLNNVIFGSYTGTGSSSGNAWALKSLDFVATAPLTTIRFAAAGVSDSYGGSLDNISLEVPEPATLSLVAGSLGLLALRRRRS